MACETGLLAFVCGLKVVAGFLPDGDLAVLQQDQVEELPNAGEDLVDLSLVSIYGPAQLFAGLHFRGKIGTKFKEARGKAQGRAERLAGLAIGKRRATGVVRGGQVEMRHKARADHDLAAYYHDARLVAVPSRYEGYGLPVLEAQVQGTRVAVADAGALPEVAGDGAVLPADDATAWAAAMSAR